MDVKLKGGKTAPRLLQDLIVYDPRRLPSTGFNILTDLPLQYEEGKTMPSQVARNSCRHAWTLKTEQSNLAEAGEKLDPLSVYLVAAFCTECRSHLELGLEFNREVNWLMPCPTSARPLHHFIYQPEVSEGREAAKKNSYSEKENEWVDTRRFRCSSSKCSGELWVRFRPPRLRAEWVSLLTDTTLINQRSTRVIAEDPERFEGHAIPRPTEVLNILRQYLINAKDRGLRRRILCNNKKWLLCLGEPCLELLQYLGFSKDGEDWVPPDPEMAAAIPLQNPLNILLNDVEKELLVLGFQRPSSEKRSVGTFDFVPISAMNDIMRVLGCIEYQQSLPPRTIDLTQEEHPFYAGLGATGDFHDDLINFAYQCQIESDTTNTPYYLECLQGIGEGRSSETLQTLAAIEASSGKISLKDVREACNDFGIEFMSTHLDDDTIIGTFQSRVSDAPRQEPELRRALKVIGQYRSSEKIQQIASNIISNYEQAIAWLGATENMDDSFIVALHCNKVAENPADEGIATQAVAIIARHRSSSALKAWLTTGVLGEVEMDVDQAYNRLEIPDRTIDDETILTAYNYHISEAPSQSQDLRNALTAVAKSRKSNLLLDFLRIGMTALEHLPSEWPVGLENIGNTCYLNSLLQFLFTVKPLRDLVLDFDQYKMDAGGEDLINKQVGSRKVFKKEVERAQRFVYELQTLFRKMISSWRPVVTPEQELARLTLMSSTIEEHIRRKSMLSGHRPSLGEINGRPVFGPLPLSSAHAGEPDVEQTGAMGTKATDDEGTNENDLGSSSDDTLVEGSAGGDSDLQMLDPDAKEQQKPGQEDKENLAPNKVGSPRLGTSASRKSKKKPRFPPEKEEKQNQKDGSALSSAPPPSRPPPFPPRPKATLDEVEIGAQQDVTEVIANVLFQLQCAIKPERIDESGEQIDQIKRLFFGKQKSYTTNQQGLTRTKEDFISDIKVDVASGSRDIYAALDGAYDVQEVEVGGTLEPQYTTISQLPPILQIHVQRAQFNPEMKTSFKSNNHLELKETIYMDRYMDTDDQDLMERRRASWAWKKEVLLLEARKLDLSKTDSNTDVCELLVTATNYLRQLAKGSEDSLNVSESLPREIEAALNDIQKELESIELRRKTLMTNIQSQFNDLRRIPYRLQSVFIHRGYVNSGHYWIYIYDFKMKIWRKYNDGYVTEIKDTTEIFKQDDGSRAATPYLVIYIKDEEKDSLVDSVCRDLVDSIQDPPDSEMKDINDEEEPDLIELESNPFHTNRTTLGVNSGWDSVITKKSNDW